MYVNIRVQTKPLVPDFPWIADRVFTSKDKGIKKNQYIVKDHFEIKSKNGNELSFNYHCDVSYNSSGDPLDFKNWQLNDIEINP